MKKKFLKNTKVILIIIFVLSLKYPGFSKNLNKNSFKKLKETNIGGFFPGQSIYALKKIGMPFPLDTAGWHTFIKPGENALIKFLLKKEAGKWKISSVILAKKGLFSRKSLLEEHQIITGKSLASIKTSKKISLGSPLNKIIKTYGPPDKKIKTKSKIQWLYYFQKKTTFIMGIYKNKAIYFEIKPI